jgi:hemolysin-activating ACP:hemolysin acyltransferase
MSEMGKSVDGNGTRSVVPPLDRPIQDESAAIRTMAEDENASRNPERGASRALTEILGQVAALMMRSAGHRHLFLSDMEWLVVPPLLIGQVRVFQSAGAPVAAAFWASVSEEVEKRLEQGETRLRPQDWKSGDRLWLIEVIAPAAERNPNALQALLAEWEDGLWRGTLQGSAHKSEIGKAGKRGGPCRT